MFPRKRRCPAWNCEDLGDVMRRGRLRWNGDVKRKDDADYVKAYMCCDGGGEDGCRQQAEEDLATPIHDRVKQRAVGRCKANPASPVITP